MGAGRRRFTGVVPIEEISTNAILVERCLLNKTELLSFTIVIVDKDALMPWDCQVLIPTSNGISCAINAARFSAFAEGLPVFVSMCRTTLAKFKGFIAPARPESDSAPVVGESFPKAGELLIAFDAWYYSFMSDQRHKLWEVRAVQLCLVDSAACLRNMQSGNNVSIYNRST